MPTSTILDSSWLQLEKSSLTQSSGGHSDTPQLNLPLVVPCSQLLVAVVNGVIGQRTNRQAG